MGTIIDDDTAPKLSFNNVSITEGNSGTTNAVFTVQRIGNLGQPLALNYSTSDGTATAAGLSPDYVATSGSLAFAPGETIKTITVPVIGDLNIEGNETFFVNLSSASSPNLAQLKGTIVNDDGIPLVSINDASNLEGNIGTANLSFSVILSAASALPVTLTYLTTDGTAVAGSDYVATTNTLTIPAGQTSGSITVQIIGDTLTEPDETFLVNLTNANNAAIVRDKATGTIRNDDTIATLSIGNAILNEGNSGTSIMSFLVTLVGGTGASVSVSYQTVSGGTATAGSDYVSTSGTLSFAPGQTTTNINVAIIGDTIFEPDENFLVQLGSPSGAVIGNGQATGLIQNDDSPPTLSISSAAVKEGNGGTVNAVFTVSLTGASQQPVTVEFFTSALTAAADADFVSTNGALTFPPGTSSLTVAVPVIGDSIPEPDETFLVNLSNPANATLVNAIGLGTILDDDSGPTLSISDAVVVEGDNGTSDAVFTVSLSSPATQQITVHVSTSELGPPPSAVAGVDYDPALPQPDLLFQPGGPTNQTVTVRVNGDTVNEPDEFFYVILSNALNATIPNSLGLGIILNDDPRPTISINDVTVTEGDNGTTDAVFTVSLSAPTAQFVTFDYLTQDGTAQKNSDYIPIEQTTLVIPAGSLNQQISVSIIGDRAEEPDEFFVVNLLNASSNAQLLDPVGRGTILNDDFVPRLSIGDASVVEGDSGTVNAIFPVALSVAAPTLTTIAYSTTDGTATTANLDYVATSGVVVFSPGARFGSISVAVNGDKTIEPDETFFVNLGTVTGGQIIVTNLQAIGTIVNDDAPPAPGVLSISDAPPVVEGNIGTSDAVFPVILSKPSLQTVTVNFGTANGLAIAGLDYVSTNGILSFAPGETNKTISVSVIGDILVEGDEVFLLNLSQPQGATIDVDQALGVIRDDDAPTNSAPAVRITSPTNGATFTAPANITISSTASDSDGTVSKVEFFSGSTLSGTDLLAPYNFTWSGVAAGSYTLTARATDNAGAVTTSSPIIITVNPPLNQPPTVSITSPASGATFTAPANITINSTASDSDGTVSKVEFFNGSILLGTDLLAPYNFTWSGVAAGTYTLTARATDNAGAVTTSSPIIITVNPPLNQPPTVSITSPTSGATFTAPANITINSTASDSDGTVSKVEFFNGSTLLGTDLLAPYNFPWSGVAAGSYTLTARATDNAGAATTSSPITITVNPPINQPPTVSITSPASGATFTAPANIAINSTAGDSDGTVSKVEFFNGSTLLATGLVAPYNFTWSGVATGNYTLTAKATDNLGATTTSGPVNIVVKQAGNLPPTLSIGDQAVTEGNSGTVLAVFNVSLSASNSLPVTVDYFTANDTALAGSDFVATNSTLIFMPGETDKTITVAVIGDTVAEETEFFSVNLTNPINASISDGQGLGFITDDDSLPTIVITDAAVTEGDSGTTNAVFNVSLSAISGQIVMVNFATADDTAKAGSDYQTLSGTLTFNPGETNKTIVVPVIGDLIGEPDESFFVNLTDVVNAALTDSQARGRITDNDSFPRFSISGATVTEGNSGNASAVFTVSLSSASLQTITVDYATTNGTATAGSDYIAVKGTLSFSPGQTSQNLTVPVIGDTLAEVDETFLVNLSNPGNAGIIVGQGLGTGTIVDDDQPPSLLITDAVVSEGNSGTTAKLVFQVRLSTASGKRVTVDYATANGTATAGSDYQLANGSLTFLPGTNLQTVTVTVNGDDLVEPDETVLVNLSNVANATIGRGQGVGKILNDEQLPSLTVTDASVTEGNSGTTNAVFTVLLSIASSQTVTVDFTTVDGTATAGSDYIAVSRAISFPPGTTATNVSVQVIGDTIQESDEFFNVRLTNAVNATIARGQGQGAIRNDDDVNSPPTQPELGITLTLDRLPVIELQGRVGTSYVVDASTNLINWITFTNVIATDTLMRFPETGAAKFRGRYYRARQGP